MNQNVYCQNLNNAVILLSDKTSGIPMYTCQLSFWEEVRLRLTALIFFCAWSVLYYSIKALFFLLGIETEIGDVFSNFSKRTRWPKWVKKWIYPPHIIILACTISAFYLEPSLVQKICTTTLIFIGALVIIVTLSFLYLVALLFWYDW